METLELSLDVWRSLLQERSLADHFCQDDQRDKVAQILFQTLTNPVHPEEAQATFDALAKCLEMAGNKGISCHLLWST